MLTGLEKQILKQLGRSNQDISNSLGITLPATKFHIHNIIKKIGAKSRTQAILIALLDGDLNLNEVIL